jgi:hypothetical protein
MSLVCEREFVLSVGPGEDPDTVTIPYSFLANNGDVIAGSLVAGRSGVNYSVTTVVTVNGTQYYLNLQLRTYQADQNYCILGISHNPPGDGGYACFSPTMPYPQRLGLWNRGGIYENLPFWVTSPLTNITVT